MRTLILLCLLSLALACNTSRSNSSSSQAPPSKIEARSGPEATHTARGNEPFWNVRIDGQGIVFRAMGQEAATYPYRPARASGQQKVFESQSDGSRISITFTQEKCIDSMSGEEFPYKVQVERDGKVLRGCGQ